MSHLVDEASTHHQQQQESASDVESGIIKKKLVSEQDRNELQMQMDSLYEDIEVVSEGEDSSSSDCDDHSMPTRLQCKNSKSMDKLSSPPSNIDNYFSSDDRNTRSPSVPNLSALPSINNRKTINNTTTPSSSSSMPNLSREAHLEQLRFIQSLNFCQNFSSIINEQYDENYSWIDSIGDYYRYGDKEKYIEPTKLPEIDLHDSQISLYLDQVEELYTNYQKSKKKPNIAHNFESEMESNYAMDIAINRELIPAIYFEEGFDLGNVKTFQEIFSEEAMSTSLLFQEKISHYLDKTEILLIQHITFRSSKIFDAFIQYNQLDDDLQIAIPLVKNLRQKIKDIDSISSKTPLEVTSLVRKRKNMKKTLEMYKVIYAIQQGQEIIDELIDHQDFLSALELINETREIVRTEYASLKCFRNLPEHLNDKTIEIQSKAQNLFISKLIEGYMSIFDNDLNNTNTTTTTTTNNNRTTTTTTTEKPLQDFIKFLTENTQPREQLYTQFENIVKPIIAVTDTQFVIHKYREKLLAFLNERLASTIDTRICQLLLKPTTPSSTTATTSTQNTITTNSTTTTTNSSISSSGSNSRITASSSSLTDQTGSKYLNSKNIQSLKLIPIDRYISLIRDLVYVGLSILQKSSDIFIILNQLLQDVGEKERTKASYVLREFEKINSTITETIHTRISFIVSLRGEDSLVKTSTKTELLTFMDICFTFIESSEKIMGGKKVNFLKSTVQAVGRTFLDEFDKQHLDSLKSILDKENWIWIENIQTKHQETVNSMIEVVVSTTTTSQPESSSNNSSNKYITIGSEQFPICASFLHLVKMTRNFLELLSPDHQKFISSFEVSSRICNLYGTFNIEVKNLILKAGAINSKSGLKTINAKHLVLTYEVLGAVVAFLTQVKLHIENLDTYLKGKLSKFDNLLTDLKEHKKSIFQKLFDIMKDVLENHAKEIVKFDWDGGQRKDSPFTAILKALLSVYKVLSSYLGTHPNDLKSLFTKISQMYSSRMKTGVQSLQRTGLSRRAIKNLKEDVVLVSKQFQQWSGSLMEDFDTNEVDSCFNECFVVATPSQPTTTTTTNSQQDSAGQVATSGNGSSNNR